MRGDPSPLPWLRVPETMKVFMGLRKLQLSPVSPVHLPCLEEFPWAALKANQEGSMTLSTMVKIA